MNLQKKRAFPWFTPNKELLYKRLTIFSCLALLTWLYLQSAAVSPLLHNQYTQKLRTLREANVEIDSEILANRLEITRNYDSLSLVEGQAQHAASDAVLIPSFIPDDDLKRLVEKVRQFQQTLDKKLQLVDRFKRTNAILRNSLAYFPVIADELLAMGNMPGELKKSVVNYERHILSFARTPAVEYLEQINIARQVLLNLQASYETQKIDNLLLHGDVIVKYLPEVHDIIQKIMSLDLVEQLEALNHTYAQGYVKAEKSAGQFRKLLYLSTLLLIAYLAFIYIRLDRTRRTLAKAHDEVRQRYEAQLLAEQSLNRHTRALAMLSAGNQVLVRSTDEQSLLEAMCHVTVSKGGYRMAWVGYRIDDAQKTVRPMASSGREKGYLEQITISWDDNVYGNGPTGLAIRTGRSHIAKDMQSDPRFSPWRERALNYGYSSSIALPLIIEGKTMGALNIYAEDKDAFDEVELPLLEEMAEDLAYGIMTLRNDNLRRQAEEQVVKSYSLLQAALEATADGLLVTSLAEEIESFNLRFANMFGIPDTLLDHGIGSKIVEFIAHKASNPSEFLENVRLITQTPEATFQDVFELKNGQTVERITQPQYLNGQIVGRVCSYRDISEQKKHEQQLSYLANHDALTALPNRNLLNDRLGQAIAQACRTGSLVAVLFFDMDGFKLINDSLGHNNGDLFLGQLAKRLPICIREGDTVARMGGDEFVILLSNIAHEEDAAVVARKLLEVVAEPFMIDEREIFSTASIGISLYPRDGDDATTLLKHADAAMYRSKAQSGNCFQFFTSEINSQVQRQFDLASKLRHALEGNEFRVYYQPQIDIGTRRVIGAEALLRWQNPEIGMVSPAEFIPIAEETGVILEIGEWVLKTVCSHVKVWQKIGLPKVKVAINLSARQFDLTNLPETFARLIDEAGVSSRVLELEITESMVMKYPDRSVKTLLEFKEMGFDISVDDFGTGYSSLGYLKRFPINKLKIDRSFVQDIPDDKDDAAITRAVIAMAHELRLKVVAEGVETEEQLAFLQEHGCDIVQGYLTGRPIAEEMFSTMLKSQL